MNLACIKFQIGDCENKVICFFYVCIKSQVRDSRNKVMHSSSMKLSHSDFINFVDAMIDLLEDPGPLGKMPGAQEAVRNIQEVSVLILFSVFSY